MLARLPSISTILVAFSGTATTSAPGWITRTSAEPAIHQSSTGVPAVAPTCAIAVATCQPPSHGEGSFPGAKNAPRRRLGGQPGQGRDRIPKSSQPSPLRRAERARRRPTGRHFRRHRDVSSPPFEQHGSQRRGRQPWPVRPPGRLSPRPHRRPGRPRSHPREGWNSPRPLLARARGRRNQPLPTVRLDRQSRRRRARATRPAPQRDPPRRRRPRADLQVQQQWFVDSWRDRPPSPSVALSAISTVNRDRRRALTRACFVRGTQVRRYGAPPQVSPSACLSPESTANRSRELRAPKRAERRGASSTGADLPGRQMDGVTQHLASRPGRRHLRLVNLFCGGCSSPSRR